MFLALLVHSLKSSVPNCSNASDAATEMLRYFVAFLRIMAKSCSSQTFPVTSMGGTFQAVARFQVFGYLSESNKNGWVGLFRL